MKAFRIVPAVSEYPDFAAFAAAAGLETRCRFLFQEQYGAGEPTDVMVDAILDALRGQSYARVIAVGGGTVLDIAKVLAVAEESDTVDTLYRRMDTLHRRRALYLVPATCGTGSEMTSLAILNRTALGVKTGLTAPCMYADEAVLIPALLGSLPDPVFAMSSIDAFIHAVESFLSPQACPLSMLFSERAIRMILAGWTSAAAQAGPGAWKPQAAAFLRASNYAGIAFGHAGCAAVHALSYPLGGAHHIPHGQANHLMFAAVMRIYQQKQPEGRLQDLRDLLAQALHVEAAQAWDALFGLMDRILPLTPLRAHGVTEAELPAFTQTVLETQQRLLQNNYVTLTATEILALYRAAF